MRKCGSLLPADVLIPSSSPLIPSSSRTKAPSRSLNRDQREEPTVQFTCLQALASLFRKTVRGEGCMG